MSRLHYPCAGNFYSDTNVYVMKRELDILVSGINIVMERTEDTCTSKISKILSIVKCTIEGVEYENGEGLKEFLNLFLHGVLFENVFLLDNSSKDCFNSCPSHAENEVRKMSLRMDTMSKEIYVPIVEHLGWHAHLAKYLIDVLFMSTASHNTAAHNTASHNTASHNTASHNTASHNTAKLGGIVRDILQYASDGRTISAILDVIIYALFKNDRDWINATMLDAIDDLMKTIVWNISWYQDLPIVTVKLMLYFLECSFRSGVDGRLNELNEDIKPFHIQIMPCKDDLIKLQKFVDRNESDSCDYDARLFDRNKSDSCDDDVRLFANDFNTARTKNLLDLDTNDFYKSDKTKPEFAIFSILSSEFNTDSKLLSISNENAEIYQFAVYDIVKTFHSQFKKILMAVDKVHYENQIVANNACCAEIFAAAARSRITESMTESAVLTRFEETVACQIHRHDLLITWMQCRRTDSGCHPDFVEFDEYIRGVTFNEDDRIKSEDDAEKGLLCGSHEWRMRLSCLERYMRETPQSQAAKYLFEQTDETTYRLLTTYCKDQISSDGFTNVMGLVGANIHLLSAESYLLAYLDFCNEAMDDDTITALLQPLTEVVCLWPLPLAVSVMIDRCQNATFNQSRLSDLDCFQQKVTALFNQLIDSDDNQCLVTALCLLDPPYIIEKAVSTAVRNSSQIRLIVKTLRTIGKLCEFHEIGKETSLLCAVVCKLIANNAHDTRGMKNLVSFVSMSIQEYTYQLDDSVMSSPAILSPEEFARAAILPSLSSANMLRPSRPITAFITTKFLHSLLTADNITPDWLTALNPHAVLLCLCEMLEDTEPLLGDDDTAAVYFEIKDNLIDCAECVLDSLEENNRCVAVSCGWLVSKLTGADLMTAVRVARALPPPLNGHQHLQELAKSFVQGGAVDWQSLLRLATASDDCAHVCSHLDTPVLTASTYSLLLIAITQVLVMLTNKEMKRLVSVLGRLVPIGASQIPGHWDRSELRDVGCGVGVSCALVDVVVMLCSEELCPWVTQQLFHHAIQLVAVTIQDICTTSEKVLQPDAYVRLLSEMFSQICRLLSTIPALFAEAIEVLAMHLIQCLKSINVGENKGLSEVKVTLMLQMRVELSSVPHKYKTLEQQLGSG